MKEPGHKENKNGRQHDGDRAGAALIADLKARGMLDDTLVIWGGEFGRTPYAENKDKEKAGRDKDNAVLPTLRATLRESLRKS